MLKATKMPNYLPTGKKAASGGTWFSILNIWSIGSLMKPKDSRVAHQSSNILPQSQTYGMIFKRKEWSWVQNLGKFDLLTSVLTPPSKERDETGGKT